MTGYSNKLYLPARYSSESGLDTFRCLKLEVAMKQFQGSKLPLYLKVAHQIEGQIRKGALRIGDRVPSIRGLRRQQGVSVSTILQAYFWLENQGWIEPRPQSGFYVRAPFAELPPEPEFHASQSVPTEVGTMGLLDEIVNTMGDRRYVPLGAAAASPGLYPNAKLNKIITKIARTNPEHSGRYELSHGLETLRRQIARRAVAYGCTFSPNDLTITCGGMEALNVAVRAVARPGDVIAIESPTYFAVLQVIESLGMKAIEIPTHPRGGMDLEALSRAIRKHRVRGCITIANCHNPLGFVLEDEYKKNLVGLLTKYDVPLIKDDIYGDVAFSAVRPKTVKTFDTEGIVLLCSSFSKVLSPGFRIGWIEAGRYRDAVRRLKFINTIAASSLPQLAIAEFIQSGGYDRYLRTLRETLQRQGQIYSQAAARYFPEGTKISRPAGGFVLWLELPKNVDAMKLYRLATLQHIMVVPGEIFSASGQFKNYIRISYGFPLDDTMEGALCTLGKLCARAVSARSSI